MQASVDHLALGESKKTAEATRFPVEIGRSRHEFQSQAEWPQDPIDRLSSAKQFPQYESKFDGKLSDGFVEGLWDTLIALAMGREPQPGPKTRSTMDSVTWSRMIRCLFSAAPWRQSD